MSVIHEKLRTSPNSQWFVRTNTAEVYGPVDLVSLQEWATQGRIEPSNEISEDQEHWRTAESLPELEMDWLTEHQDGTVYGPFNIHLAPELAANGILSPGAILTHRHTGETRPMDASNNDSMPPKKKTPAKNTTAKRKATKKKVVSSQKRITPEPKPVETPEVTDIAPSAPEAEVTPEASAPTEDAHQTEVTSPTEPTPVSVSDKGSELVSQRLETLQQSASQARTQLAATRKQLTEQRASATAMQDQIRKLQDDVRSAETEKEGSEQRLLEQQDQLAAALSEVENLNAQFQQLQDHYDRLQIESQSQFEALDGLRAESMQHEQEFKHSIGVERDKAEAKTTLLARALQLIIQDEDVEHGPLPKELLINGDEGQIQELQSRTAHLQQQADLERKHSQDLERKLATSQGNRGRNLLLIILLILIVGLISALAFIIGSRQEAPALLSKTPATKVEQKQKPIEPPQAEQAALAGLIVTNTERFKRTRPTRPAALAEPDLDLLPEEVSRPAIATHSPVTWPQLSVKRSTITEDAMSCTVVFTYGLFSSSTKITREGAEDLKQIAKQLAEHQKDFTLLVEGHTDATPISSPSAKYVDNFALGMARAEAVKYFLETQCGLPEDFIRTASAGESDPPHLNDTEASRLKNRTVVLSLTPR